MKKKSRQFKKNKIKKIITKTETMPKSRNTEVQDPDYQDETVFEGEEDFIEETTETFYEKPTRKAGVKCSSQYKKSNARVMVEGAITRREVRDVKSMKSKVKIQIKWATCGVKINKKIPQKKRFAVIIPRGCSDLSESKMLSFLVLSKSGKWCVVTAENTDGKFSQIAYEPGNPVVMNVDSSEQGEVRREAQQTGTRLNPGRKMIRVHKIEIGRASCRERV